MNYNNKQWLIVDYSPGAGGKFLLNCFMQYDKVAHWHGKMSKEDRVYAYLSTIPMSNSSSWIKNEMTSPWGLDFFSRAHPRNNNISNDGFNQLVLEHATDYFHTCWNDGNIIPDYWQKASLPGFWSNAIEASILIDDFDLYKRLLFSKPYTYTKEDCVVKSLTDNPNDHSTSISGNKNAKRFNNQWVFNDVDNIDDFFETELKDKCWFIDRLSKPQSQTSINLSDMFDTNKLCVYLESFEDTFGETLPKNNIIKMHTPWLIKTDEFLSNL